MIHVAKKRETLQTPKIVPNCLHQNPYHIRNFQNCRILFRNNPNQEHSIAAASIYKKVVQENPRANGSAFSWVNYVFFYFPKSLFKKLFPKTTCYTPLCLA